MELHIDDATQYATAYDDDGNPFCTLQRRRVYGERHLPAWRIYATDGTLLGQCWHSGRDYANPRRMVAQMLAARAKGLPYGRA